MRIIHTFVFPVLLVAAAMVVQIAAVPGTVFGISSAQAAVVSRVDVNGNIRVDDDTVRSYITIEPGVSFGAADIDESIKTLFATGLFSDVSINQRGAVLIVTVSENAVISRISFEGNRRINDETLSSVVQSQPRSSLSTTIVQGDVQRVLELYRRRGRFGASVETKVIELPQNRVDLVFEIDENRETGIARVAFIGNRAFSDGRLREVIETRQSGFLGFLRRTDVYDPDRLEADQERLRQFYFNNGFADFRIISAVADFDRERNVFFVTFTVDEGEKYRFGDIEVQTSLVNIDPQRLERVVQTREGRVYNAGRVERSIEDMVIAVAEDGYAFAQIRPRGDRDFENKTINVTYYVDEGPRVFVERIEIRGNTKTREYVIRREFDFAEGDAFNRVLLDKAERRLNELDFFQFVRITTRPGSAPDRVVIVVDVADKATGEIGFGAGLSTADGVVGDVSVSERNFLGRGQFVRASVGLGEDTQTYNFQFAEPYFLGRRIRLSTRLFQNEQDANDFRSYDLSETGGSIGLGLPLNDELTLNVFYRASNRDLTISPGTNTSTAIQQIVGDTFTSLIGYNLVYSTLDSTRNPRDGFYVTVGQEFAGVGGDVFFVRTEADATVFRELLPSIGLVGSLRARAGHIEGLGQNLQILDQFLAGPSYVRGFDNQGFGPRDGVTRDALGAKTVIAGTAEVSAPLPLLPPEFGLSIGGFFDVGTAFGTDSSQVAGVVVVADDASIIRSSVGGSIIWNSPFGRIRGDFAYPITKSTFDETQFFRVGGSRRF